MDNIILGIDPGSRSTGYGVIRNVANRYEFIDCGFIAASSDALSERLHTIFQGISEVVQTHSPNEVAIERVFFHQNPAAALKLGQARGAAMVACAQAGLPIAEYSPREIKQAIVGYGAAQKEQVQHMIRALLKLDETPQNDAADALAIAITHVHLRSGLADLMKGRKTSRRRR